MLGNAVVTVVSTTTNTNAHGDSTSSTTEATLDWALLAPRASSERVDPRSPAVITAATLYAAYDSPIGSDDTVNVAGHSVQFDGAWQVEGIPGPWSMGSWRPGMEVALKRAGS